MKTLLHVLTALLLLFAYDAGAQHATYYGRTEAALELAQEAISDSADGLRGEIKFTARDTVKARVSFVFDDGDSTTYTMAYPTFAAQGEVGCSAVITGSVGTGAYMTWTQIKALSSAGWEIMSHTVTHDSLSFSPEADILTELASSKAAIEAQGLTCTNLAYPYGLQNELVRTLARRYYRSARGTGQVWGKVNDPAPNLYNLMSNLADDHTALATYQTWVDQAVANDGWLIFYIHAVSADDTTALSTLIDYCQAQGAEIMTIEQALDDIGPVADVAHDTNLGVGGLRAPYAYIGGMRIIGNASGKQIYTTSYSSNFVMGGGTSAADGAYIDVRGSGAASGNGTINFATGASGNAMNILSTRDVVFSRERTAAGSDSSLTITVTNGQPILRFNSAGGLQGTLSITDGGTITSTAPVRTAGMFPMRMIMPTVADTTIDGTIPVLNDSLTINEYLLASAWPDSGKFHRALNIAADTDTVKVGSEQHIPAPCDSFVVFVRSDANGEASVDIVIKGANGTTVLSQTVTPTVDDAWDRFVFYRAAAVTEQDYLITYRYRVNAGHYIDVSPVTAKLAD